MSLSKLLKAPTLDEFFEKAWERAPLLSLGAIGDAINEILTLDQFEALTVSAASGTAPGLSVVQDHKAQPVVAGDGRESPLPWIYAAYSKKCSLLISGLEARWAPIRSICREIQNELVLRGLPLAEAVGANAYLTPASAQGFDIHYDDHCVLVLQLHGSKIWSVFPPTNELPVTRCEHPISRSDLGSPLVESRLAAGDVLYIPRGFPHYARTDQSTSLHVTFSIRPVVWAEALHRLCQLDPVFRRSVILSTQGTPAAREYFQQVLAPRLEEMDVDRLIERRIAEGLARLTPVPSGWIRGIDRLATLGPSSAVVRAPYVVCMVHVEEAEVVLSYPGASLRLPVSMKPVMDFLAHNTEFTPEMLPQVEPSYDRLDLVRLLIKRGLLVPDDTSFAHASASRPNVTLTEGV